MSAYFKNGTLIESVDITATSSGTLTLTANSSKYQQLTGTSSHTVKLPATSAVTNGFLFFILNRSTTSISVVDSASAALGTIEANNESIAIYYGGVWRVLTSLGGSLNDSNKVDNLQGVAKTESQNSTLASGTLNYAAEVVGGGYSISRGVTAAVARSFNGQDSFFIGGYTTLAGGFNGAGNIINLVERFDHDIYMTIAKTNLPAARASHFHFSNGGFGWLHSGRDGTGGTDVTSVTKYADATDTWTAATDALTRSDGTGLVLAGKNFIFAGSTTATPGTVTNLVHAYNISTGAYLTSAPMITARIGCVGAILGNRGYIFHGASTRATGATVVATSECYNAESNYFSSINPMIAQRHYSAVCSNGSRVIHTGGTFSNATQNGLEIYDMETQYSIQGQPLASVINAHAPCSGNGTNFIVGGTTAALSTAGTVNSITQLITDSFQSTGKSVNTRSANKLLVSTVLGSSTVSVPVQINVGQETIIRDTNSSIDLTSLALMRSAQLMIVGGNTGASVEQSTAYRYTRFSDSWYTAGSLPATMSLSGSFNIDKYGFAVADTRTYRYDYEFNSSTTRASKPESAVYGTAGTELKSFGFCIGGFTVSTFSYNHRYSNASNSWAIRSTLTGSRAFGGAFNIDDRIYYANGNTGSSTASGHTNTVWEYNDYTNAIVTTTSSPASTSFVGFDSFNGKGCVGTGFQGASAYQSLVYVYDRVPNSWSSFDQTTNRARAAFGSIGESREEMSMLGGFNGGTTYNLNTVRIALANVNATKTAMPTALLDIMTFDTSEFYNIKVKIGTPRIGVPSQSRVWISKGSTPSIRTYGAYWNLGDGFYHAGGFNGSTNINTAIRYDDQLNTWKERAQYPNAAVRGMGSFVIGDRGYWSGGADTGADTQSTSIYNPFTNAWAVGTSNGTAQTCHNGNRTLNDYGYNLGGQVGGGSGTSRNQRFEPVTTTWSTKAVIPSISIFAGTSVMNGFLYTAGVRTVAAGASATNTGATYRYSDQANAWVTMTSKTNPSVGAFRRSLWQNDICRW
jgi:hypothetical protein